MTMHAGKKWNNYSKVIFPDSHISIYILLIELDVPVPVFSKENSPVTRDDRDPHAASTA